MLGVISVLLSDVAGSPFPPKQVRERPLAGSMGFCSVCEAACLLTVVLCCAVLCYAVLVWPLGSCFLVLSVLVGSCRLSMNCVVLVLVLVCITCGMAGAHTFFVSVLTTTFVLWHAVLCR